MFKAITAVDMGTKTRHHLMMAVKVCHRGIPHPFAISTIVEFIGERKRQSSRSGEWFCGQTDSTYGSDSLVSSAGSARHSGACRHVQSMSRLDEGGLKEMRLGGYYIVS